MEEVLEAVILGGGDDEEIEWVILNNILIDRDEAEGAAAGNFDINNYSDEDTKLHFRFSRNDILRLLHCLNLPNEIQTDSRNKVNSKSFLKLVGNLMKRKRVIQTLDSYFGNSISNFYFRFNSTMYSIEAFDLPK